MPSLITVLVPNYNRPRSLARLLRSVTDSIAHARAEQLVSVLVVDDYSPKDINGAVEPFLKLANFNFRMQTERCGNAEVAFLTSQQQVETEYTWLLGNDDIVSLDAVGRVLGLIEAFSPGLVLLNPRIVKASIKLDAAPIVGTSPVTLYGKAADLFADFGFVTSTTTFPCLIFKSAPVANLHRREHFPKAAAVYSHTFTLFAALHELTALYYSPQIVAFNLNEREEEHTKLVRQSPGLEFHHQTIGLVRLLRLCSSVTGLGLDFFGGCAEDEIDKDSLKVFETTQAYFLLFFSVEQIIRDLLALDGSKRTPRFLMRTELSELGSIFHDFGDEAALAIFEEALGLYVSDHLEAAWKIRYLRELQAGVRKAGRKRYWKISDLRSADSPKKLLISSGAAFTLAGSRARR